MCYSFIMLDDERWAMPLHVLTEEEAIKHGVLLRHHRSAHRRSRVQSIVVLASNEETHHRFWKCVWCGAVSRDGITSQHWEVGHIRTHLIDIDAELVAFDARESGRTGSQTA